MHHAKRKPDLIWYTYSWAVIAFIAAAYGFGLGVKALREGSVGSTYRTRTSLARPVPAQEFTPRNAPLMYWTHVCAALAFGTASTAVGVFVFAKAWRRNHPKPPSRPQYGAPAHSVFDDPDVQITLPEHFGADREDLIRAHTHSSRRDELLASELCGCFYCCQTFPTLEIENWINEGGKGAFTAVCPRCEIDAVIGSKSGFPITHRFLRDMHKYWFKRGIQVKLP